MKEKTLSILRRTARYLEITLSVVIAAVIGYLIVKLIISLLTDPAALTAADGMNDFLSSAFTLIVGIEFLVLALNPSADSVLDMLVFTVARQIVLNHDMVSTLLGIVCIGVLLEIRRRMQVVKKEGGEVVSKETLINKPIELRG